MARPSGGPVFAALIGPETEPLDKRVHPLGTHVRPLTDEIGAPQMDDANPQQLPPAPQPAFALPPGGQLPMQSRAPGRPPIDQAQRENNDQAYAAIKKFSDRLPKKATDEKILIYRINPRTGMKKSVSPEGFILLSDFTENSFADNEEAFREYIAEQFGPGHYKLEPADSHGKRIPKLPAWEETVEGDEEMDDAENRDEDRRGRRERDSRRGTDRFEDDEREPNPDEDDVGRRGDRRSWALNWGAALHQDQLSQERQASAKSNDIVTLMMLQQQSAAEQRRMDEDRRREEDRRNREQEKSLREERMAEERRREDQRREEDRRREEVRQADDRRRDDERRAEREAETRRAEERWKMIGALAPIVAKVFEPKPQTQDPIMATVLAKALEPNPLMIKMFESQTNKDQMNELVKTISDVQRIASELQAKSMGSLIEQQGQASASLMKQAVSMGQQMGEAQASIKNGDPKAGMEKWLGIATQAVSMVKDLGPVIAAGMRQQQANAQQPNPQMAPNVISPAQPQAPAAEAPQRPRRARPDLEASEQVIPGPGNVAQQQSEEPITGTRAVMHALRELSYGQPDDRRDRLCMIFLQEMPPELAQAVIAGDEAATFGATVPVVTSDPALAEWVVQPGVEGWIRNFLAQMRPSVKAFQDQRTAPKPQAAPSPAAEAPAPEAAPAPVAQRTEEPMPQAASAPAPAAAEVTATEPKKARARAVALDESPT